MSEDCTRRDSLKGRNPESTEGSGREPRGLLLLVFLVLGEVGRLGLGWCVTKQS